MNPLTKGILIGIVAVLGVSAIVIFVLPVVDSAAYQAIMNGKISQMNNPIMGKGGKICESNYYNLATGYCQNEPLYAVQSKVIADDVKMTTELLWRNMAAFENQYADDPKGECKWLQQRLNELESLEQSDFNEDEWHELYVVTSKYRNTNLNYCR